MCAVSLNPSLVTLSNTSIISGTSSTIIDKFLDQFGNPISAATVIAFQQVDSGFSTPLFQGVVAADGSWNVTVVNAGTYNVQLTGGGTSKVRTVFLSNLSSTNISGLAPITDTTLDTASSALGPVLDPGGRPIIGAEIQLFSGNDTNLATPLFDPAFSGGNGSFRVFGATGNNYQCVFSAKGFNRIIRNVNL